MDNELVVEDEIIRARVREEFKAAQNGNGGGFWKLVNSPIFLWFLSSILLASLASVYEIYKSESIKESALATRKENLKAEISYRLDTDLLQMFFESKFENSKDPATVEVQKSYPTLDIINYTCLPAAHHEKAVLKIPIFPIGDSLQSPIRSGIKQEQKFEEALLKGRFIYPEFNDRSIFSLLWELRRIETDEKQLKYLNNALNSISDMRKAAIAKNKDKTIDIFFQPVNLLLASW